MRQRGLHIGFVYCSNIYIHTAIKIYRKPHSTSQVVLRDTTNYIPAKLLCVICAQSATTKSTLILEYVIKNYTTNFKIKKPTFLLKLKSILRK